MTTETRCPVLINFSGLKETAHFKYLAVEGMIILKWILSAFGRKEWTGIIWLKTGTDAGLL
jgi:hypothetical protein